jgi:hypothetical protein
VLSLKTYKDPKEDTNTFLVEEDKRYKYLSLNLII